MNTGGISTDNVIGGGSGGIARSADPYNTVERGGGSAGIVRDTMPDGGTQI